MPIETFHIAHTISNKLVIKVSAKKKGGKSYDSYKLCVQISEVSGVVPPLMCIVVVDHIRS